MKDPAIFTEFLWGFTSLLIGRVVGPRDPDCRKHHQATEAHRQPRVEALHEPRSTTSRHSAQEALGTTTGFPGTQPRPRVREPTRSRKAVILGRGPRQIVLERPACFRVEVTIAVGVEALGELP